MTNKLVSGICIVEIAFASLSYACAGERHQSPVGGQFEMRPAHLTTNVDGRLRPTIVVDFTSDGEGQTPDNLPVVVLRRFGESEPLAISSEAVLPVGWYTATVDLTDAQAEIWSVAAAAADASDTTVFYSDFHVGSAPVATLRALNEPISGNESHRVLEFRVSESCTLLADNPEAWFTIQVGGSPAHCAWQPQGGGSISDELEVSRHVMFSCAEDLSDGVRVMFDVAPGVVSLTGEPLRDLEGRTAVHVDMAIGDATGPRATSALVLATSATGAAP